MMTTCSVEACDRDVKKTKICDMHKKRLQRTGSVHGRILHGHAKSGRKTRTYISYRAMLERCTRQTNHNFKYYGARGITVCKRWQGPQGFINFLNDMGERPQDLTLDRKNVNGNYTPHNCKWSTAREQRLNQRKRQTQHKGH